MSDTFLVAVEKCPLCESTRKKFTCNVCIRNGNFSHSLNSNSSTYADKSKSVSGLIERKSSLLYDVVNFAQCNEQSEKKKTELVRLSQRVQTLKEVVCSLEGEITIGNSKLCERREQFKRRLKEIGSLDNSENDGEVARCETKFTELKEILKGVQLELVRARKQSIQRLKEDIFPITIRPVYKDFGTPPGETLATRGLLNDLVVETSNSPESDLEEATKCQYKEGEWVQTSLSENEYCIAGCALPASSEYVKYFEWLKSYRKDARGSDTDVNVHAHPALTIPAALTYTCQLLLVSSKILGVNLPFKVKYRELSNPHIDLMRLCDYIWKLNRNVCFICFSQLMRPCQLFSMQALQNLDTCLSDNNPFLGHTEYFETYPVEIESLLPDIEQHIIEDCDFASDEDEFSIKEEWDSLKDLQELPKDISYSEGRSSSSEQYLSSSATGLVTSAAASVVSLWPWKKN